MILAADLGTGSLKAGILSSEGRLEAEVRIKYRRSPYEGDFDPREWEDAFGRALDALPAVRLSALALSGNGPTLVLCDEKGDPAGPADLWLDEGAVSLPGRRSYYLPMAARRKARDEGAWKGARMILSCPEWLQFRLTGVPSMTLPHESFRPYVWDDEQLEAYGLDGRLFPETVYMGELAGRVNAAASARFGLERGLPAAAAGSDFMTALLGSGALEPGMVCDRAGTSEGINCCAGEPSGDGGLRDVPHVVEGLWNVAAVLSSTGAVLEWFRRVTGQEDRGYEETLAEVEGVEAGGGAPLFFPGALGETLWEFRGGSFQGLEPVHGRAEMGRAVMEAVGFAVRRGIEQIEAAGLPVDEMRVTGGQARGAAWNRMKADITGRRLLIPEIEDAELAGCAACADAVLGRSESPHGAAGTYVRIREVLEPRWDISRRYDEVYQRYREAAEGVG